MQKPGKALWRRITSEFDLKPDPDKAELLFQACKVADQIAELDEAAAEAPLTVRGSMGQPVISPYIAEARVQRGLLAQLLARMNFAEAGEDD
ncbi:hypothetical protein [Mycobacterium sp. IS-1742]|uniref:hypothetical protein n=1 Tax=Mycobacterium sp. IS-1742 TaxID=1772285 RepID=UPI001E4A900B|nr:hypothetical protein [Mycobacterium sp. IS-1742]